MDNFSDKIITDSDIYMSYKKIKSLANKNVNCIWLGAQDYNPIFKLQKKLQKENINGNISDVVLLLEHNHVYTLGKNANSNHILSLNDKSKIVQSDRGGDVTYHGPGQLVGYPIVNLNKYNKSITWYIDFIQTVIISFLKEYEIKASKKNSPLVGVWVGDEKIAAIGVRLSRWVTMHGFAINVNTNLDYYNKIIPCGIFDLGVTSIKELKGKELNIEKNASKISRIIESSLVEEGAIC